MALVGLLAAAGLYTSQFHIRATPESLMRAAKEYVSRFPEGQSVKPEYVDRAVIGRQMLVFFRDEAQAKRAGHVVFLRGVNGLWMPIEASYSTGPAVHVARTSPNLGKDTPIYTAYFATNLPPEVASYAITGPIYNDQVGTFETTTVTRETPEPVFFDVYRTGDFLDMQLFDAAGRELPRSEYQAIRQDLPSLSISTAELGIVPFISFVFLFLGLLGGASVWCRGHKLAAPKADAADEYADNFGLPKD